MKHTVIGACLGASLAACSGGAGELGTTHFEAAGQTIDVKSSAFVFHPDDQRPQLAIVLSDHEDTCDALESGAIHLELSESGAEGRLKNTGALVILLFADAPLAEGSYPMANFMGNGDDPRVAWIQFSKTGPSCEEMVDEQSGFGVLGSVELEEFEPGEDGVAAGRFDVRLGKNAEPLAGRFSAPFCASADKGAPRECR